MSTPESGRSTTADQAWSVVDLMEDVYLAPNLEQLAERLLPAMTNVLHLTSACLYVADSRLPAPRFFHRDLGSQMATDAEGFCEECFSQISSEPEPWAPSGSTARGREAHGDLVFYPLRTDDGQIGILGLPLEGDDGHPEGDLLERTLPALAAAIAQAVAREETAKRLSQLNAYLTVSSMLAQTMDLHELLQLSLYCCMEVVSAQEASVLLLDDEKENLRFYHVEGPAKEALEGASFPADAGLAGTVLRTRRAEVINDPYSDPRFYDKVDSDFGFPTNNLIAFPLVAGEEPVGVMEVVNKHGGEPFTDGDRLLLMSIAEEIAFAIRNAKVFDYVVSTYCKQRQGQTSCRGCKRPLGSWTPCVKYRDGTV